MERSTTQRVGCGKAARATQARCRFQPPATVGLDPFGQGPAVVAGIGKYELQPVKALAVQFFQCRPPPGSVVLVGRPDVGGQQPAAHVNGELALAALNLFVAVKAFVGHAARAALDGLGVNDGHAWAGLARGGRPPALVCNQHFTEFCPAPVGLPTAEMVKANRVRRQVIGQ